MELSTHLKFMTVTILIVLKRGLKKKCSRFLERICRFQVTDKTCQSYL